MTNGEEEYVNIDAIVLDEASWYVVAVTETNDPEKWLAYAQDRKMEDPRYSVAAFRRDIRVARLTQAVADMKEAREHVDEYPRLESFACPWIKLLCVHSGKPEPVSSCSECAFAGKTHYNLNAQVTEK